MMGIFCTTRVQFSKYGTATKYYNLKAGNKYHEETQFIRPGQNRF